MKKSATKKDGKKMDDSFLDALENSETTKPKKYIKRGSVEIKAPVDVRKAIDIYNTAKADKKAAEGTMKKHEATILEYVRKEQDKAGFEGNFLKSFDVEGKDGKVKYVSSNRHSVKNDDVNLIKEILGESFDTLIKKTWKIWVKPTVIENRESQKELMKIMGKRFSEFLETSSSLVPCDDFDKKVFDACDSQEDLDDLRTFVKPYKASLR